MYKALNYWVFGGFDGQKTPYEFIDFVAAQGLDGAELTLGDAVKPEISDAECDKIRDYAKSKKVGLRTMATGFYWGCAFGASDPAERAKAAGFTRNYLRIASRLGAETILAVPGATKVAWDASHAVEKYADVWRNSVAELKKLAVDAAAAKVRIGLENVWNRFLLSPMEWKFYLDEIGSDYVGIYLDLGNCDVLTPASDYIEILGKKVFAVHAKNFSGGDCGGGLHGFGDDLLTGDVDFAAAKRALEAIGYTGTVTAEMIPFSRLPDLVLPDQVLAEKTAQQLKTLF